MMIKSPINLSPLFVNEIPLYCYYYSLPFFIQYITFNKFKKHSHPNYNACNNEINHFIIYPLQRI